MSCDYPLKERAARDRTVLHASFHESPISCILELWPMLKEALRWKQFHFPILSSISNVVPE